MPQPVVGRGPELAQVGDFLAADEAGFGLLVLQGEPGIGKTTLWEQAVGQARDRGYAVLSCKPTAAERRLSYAALGDLLARPPAEAYSDLPGAQRRALDAVLLRGDTEARPPERRALAVAFLSILRRLAEAAPVLLAVDDAQWLDRPSAGVLEFAARRLDGERVRIVTAVRLTPEPARTFDRALDSRRRSVVELGPLSIAALHAMIAERLGYSVTRPTLLRVAQASAGNPFYALEIARELLRRDEPSAGATVPVPHDVEKLLLARIRRLPEETRGALLIASALSTPTVDLVEAAPLAPAEEENIVRVEDEGRIVFSHPLFASAVYSSAPGGRRRELHRRLAALVDEPEERARHLALATTKPAETVAAALEKGASHARSRGAWESAAELLEQAAALTPNTRMELRRRRRLAAAEHHVHAGDRGRGRAALEELLAEPLPPALRTEALLVLAEISYNDENFPEAGRIFGDALACADDPALRAESLIGLGYVRSNVMDFSGGATEAYRALEQAEAAGDRRLIGEALALCAMMDFLSGRGVDWDRMERSLALEEPESIVSLQRRPSTIAALLELYVGRSVEARERLRTLCAAARERGDESDLAFALLWLSWEETRSGDCDAAAALADEAASLAALTGSPSMDAWARTQRAYVRAHRGEIDETRRDCAVAAAPVRRSGNLLPTLWIAASLALLELSLGNPEAAWRACEPLTLALEQEGIAEPVPAFFLPDALEALIALGRLDRAEALLDAFEERGRRLDRPWALATAGRCRGLLLAARGDLVGAAEALEQALAAHARLQMPFEHGRTLMVKGMVERRARRRAQAKQSFETALGVFDRIGARLWIERTRRELERLGLRRSARDQLTESERRVAELAAEGLTNRDVAAALFMSPKTVEANLSRVYGKLGISSRAELGARMAEMPRR
jgi:DNA-binding CsgD family transcriptional regulator